MNEKTRLKLLCDLLAGRQAIPKRQAEDFVRAWMDTVAEGLQRDGQVQTGGIGSFRIIDTEPRQSVSVSTGERITLPASKKIIFTPSDRVTGALATMPHHSEPSAPASPSPAEEPQQSSPTPPQTAPTTARDESEEGSGETIYEQPADDLSGIDVLIATPESVDDARQMLLHANEQAEAAGLRLAQANDNWQAAQAAVEQARAAYENAKQAAGLAQTEYEQAQDEQRAAQTLVENCQQRIANIEEKRNTNIATPQQTADVKPPPPIDESTPIDEPTPIDGPEEGEEQPLQVNSPIQEQSPAAQTLDDPVVPRRSRLWVWLLILLIGIGVANFFFVSHCLKSTSAPTPSPPPPAKDTLSTPVQVAEPVIAPMPQDTLPRTYTLQRGESLTDVAVKIYGTKDSLSAIIRANHFNDINNVLIGTIINLP